MTSVIGTVKALDPGLRMRSPGAAHAQRHLPDPDRDHHHVAALHMVTMQGGVFGCVATSDDVIAATT